MEQSAGIWIAVCRSKEVPDIKAPRDLCPLARACLPAEVPGAQAAASPGRAPARAAAAQAATRCDSLLTWL